MLKGAVLNSNHAYREDITRIGGAWYHCGPGVQIVYLGLESVPGVEWLHEAEPFTGNHRGS